MLTSLPMIWEFSVYIKISGFLTKALEISPDNLEVKQELIKVRKTMGFLAKKQKNFLLSYSLFKQCLSLGDKKAYTLLKKLEKEKKQLEKNHKQFITKTMQEMLEAKTVSQEKELMNRYIDQYVYTIIIFIGIQQ